MSLFFGWTTPVLFISSPRQDGYFVFTKSLILFLSLSYRRRLLVVVIVVAAVAVVVVHAVVAPSLRSSE